MRKTNNYHLIKVVLADVVVVEEVVGGRVGVLGEIVRQLEARLVLLYVHVEHVVVLLSRGGRWWWKCLVVRVRGKW